MNSIKDTVDLLNAIIQRLNISTGLIVFIFGIIGNILNIIIFMSLKTFRQNPCAFCLIILSISSIGNLILNTLVDSLVSIANKQDNVDAIIPCRVRVSLIQCFGILSRATMCIAAIDQAISTNRLDRHPGINIRIIRIVFIIVVFISILHSIPFLIFYDVQLLPGTNDTICRISEKYESFSKYVIYINVPIIHGIIPFIIMTVFALIAFRNIREMRKTKIHVTRLRLEQQLTAMVLTQILSVCITVVPYLTIYIVRYIISSRINDVVVQHKILLVHRILIALVYINCAVSLSDAYSFVFRYSMNINFILG